MDLSARRKPGAGGAQGACFSSSGEKSKYSVPPGAARAQTNPGSAAPPHAPSDTSASSASNAATSVARAPGPRAAASVSAGAAGSHLLGREGVSVQ